MTEKNIYSSSMTSKTESELFDIVKNKTHHILDVRKAAINELENRNISNDDISSLRIDIDNEVEKINSTNDSRKINLNKLQLKPESFKNASKLVYATIIIGFIKVLIFAIIGVNLLSPPTHLLVFMVTAILTFLLGYFIGLGNKWARNILFVIVIIGMLGIPLTIVRELRLNSLIGIMTMIQYGLHIGAFILLFGKDSNSWYERN